MSDLSTTFRWCSEMPTYTLGREPRGSEYRELLALGEAACSEALLVIRDGIELSDEGRKLVERLSPHVIEQARSSEWPGTRLLTPSATVIKFAYTSESAELLKSSSEGLFDWRQPQLPEDLSLLRPNGDPWLVTISHEQDAFLDLSEIELASIRRTLPRLAVALHADDD